MKNKNGVNYELDGKTYVLTPEVDGKCIKYMDTYYMHKFFLDCGNIDEMEYCEKPIENNANCSVSE